MDICEIVEQYVGPFDRTPESISGDGKHMRVMLQSTDDDGNTTHKVLFTGSEFSEDEFAKRMELFHGKDWKSNKLRLLRSAK